MANIIKNNPSAHTVCFLYCDKNDLSNSIIIDSPIIQHAVDVSKVVHVGPSYRTDDETDYPFVYLFHWHRKLSDGSLERNAFYFSSMEKATSQEVKLRKAMEDYKEK